MKNIVTTKNDCFDSLLQSNNIEEFADGILAYRDNIGEDFTLEFYGITLTTEDCKNIKEFLKKNEEALENCEPIQNLRKKEQLQACLDAFISGEASLDNINFVKSDNVNFNKKLKELESEIKFDNEMLSDQIVNKIEIAETIVDLPNAKEAFKTFDKLPDNLARKKLEAEFIEFINKNIESYGDSKEEVLKLLDKRPNNDLSEVKAEIKKVETEIKKIKTEMKNRKKIAEAIKKNFLQRNDLAVDSEMTENKEVVAKETVQESVVEEKKDNSEFISKLESIASEGPIFQDLDLSVGYSYGVYKNAASKIDEQKKLANPEPNLIPDLEVEEAVNKKVQVITNIVKASVTLIEKVRSIDFKSKINAGLEKIKAFGAKVAEYTSNMADKVAEYADELADKYYDKKLEYATAKVEKYSKMENDMNDLIAARGLSR